MNLPDGISRILESTEAKAVALVVGIAAGLVKLLQPAAPWLVQPFATASLVLAGLYLVWIVAGLIPPRKAALSEAERAHRYLAKRYGYAYNVLEVECSIRPDGSAEVRRRVQVRARSQIANLGTVLLVPEPAPDGQARDVGILSVRSLTPGYNVSREFVRGTRTSSAELTIAPRLNDGETLTYEMTEVLPAGLYAIDLTPEELSKRKTPFDYFGWNINRPTRALSLKVYFPERAKPDEYNNEVRHAPVAVPRILERPVYHEEQGRLETPSLQGPEGGRYFLRQRVDYPMVGLIYLLRWEPLGTTSRSGASVAAVPADGNDLD